MKVSKKDVLLLLGLLGVLAVVFSYFLVYQPTMEKVTAMKQENAQLQERIDDLSSKMDNKDSYVADTEHMNQEIEAVYQRFPVDVREEDSLLLAITQELVSPMIISNISISACEPAILPDSEEEDIDPIYEIDEVEEYEAQEGISDDETNMASVDANGVSNEDMPSILMERNVTLEYLVSYEGLKRSVKNVCAQDNRISINEMTVTYDETTGLLKGNTSVDMYCIPGQEGKEYVQPNFSSVLLGTDDIFGSIELYDKTLGLISEDAIAGRRIPVEDGYSASEYADAESDEEEE